MIETPAFERLKRSVIERTGHAYYADKDRLLYERARERMNARGAPTLDAYLDLLDRAGDEEWRALEDVVTVGETYFFRYPDHFEALRNEILPGLIANRHATRALRIWSIGCASGAEPYSVAILLRELLGDDIETWRIALVGGDISERALAQARSGRFSAWALRTMGPEDRAKYFDHKDAIWTLKPVYRAMVRFERQNILDLMSPTPPLAWNEFDLILCRNVLIYFSPPQAVAITQALAKRLTADGSLLLGHAEATLAADPGLAYAPKLPTEFGQALRPAITPPAYTPPVLPDMPALARKPAAPSAANDAPPQAPTDLLAQIELLADAGEYEAATRLCRDLIAVNPMSAGLHYYDAVLRQVSDDLDGAEAELKRALYLDRAFILAHHRLGMLLLGRGHSRDARRSLMTALRLAESAQPETLVAEGHGMTAGALADLLRGQLENIGTAA